MELERSERWEITPSMKVPNTNTNTNTIIIIIMCADRREDPGGQS